MSNFWPWLLLHVGTWLVLALGLEAGELPVVVLLSAVYLAGYFVANLAVTTAWASGGRAASLLAALAAIALLGPGLEPGLVVIGGLLLCAPVLGSEAVRGERRWSGAAALLGGALAVGVLAYATWLAVARPPATAAAAPGVISNVATAGVIQGGGALVAMSALGALGTVLAITALRRSRHELADATARYQALVGEYRNLKRRAAESANAARGEERMSVARRLHDSVGHKLTSLLMQLEVERLQVPTPEARARAAELKRLAQDSLDETRRAVKALSEEDLAGLPALLRLIRNLEGESSLQVDFTVRQGALSAPLDRAPAIALYRAVQEALTNAMRHGSSRRVEVAFEAPAGRVFRFEVGNDAASADVRFKEGFGLTSMRERVEAAGGQLEVFPSPNRFVVRGSFPLES